MLVKILLHLKKINYQELTTFYRMDVPENIMGKGFKIINIYNSLSNNLFQSQSILWAAFAAEAAAKTFCLINLCEGFP